MAIKFLNALNIDGTVTATINQDANNAYDGILVSTSGLIERRTKAQILADIGAGTGSMSSFVVSADTNTAVTTITNGETLSLVGGTGISTTSNPDGTITITSSASGYSGWDLAGDSGTDQTIASGNTATFAGGTKITTATSATDVLTITHDSQTQSDSTTTGTLSSGGNFAVPTVSVDTTGHVTGTDTKTITIDAFDNYTGWKLDAESSGSTLSVGSGATVDFIGGTGITTAKASGPNLTITNSKPFDKIVTAGDSGTSNITNNDTITFAGGTGITTADNGSGTITITASGSGTMSSWTLAGSSGTSQTISDGNTATFIQGNGISTVASDTDDLTITNTKPFDNLTLKASAGSDSTIANNGIIIISAGSNISTTNNGSGSVEIAYTGGTGSMNSWTLSDGTTSETISNGNTVLVQPDSADGKEGITTVVSATDTLTIGLDLNLLDLQSTIDAANDMIVYVNDNDQKNEKIVFSDVHLNQWGDAEADVAFGSNKLTGVADGTAATDGVNLGQVETLVAGQSLFKGAYDATNEPGSPAISGSSNIANSVGDFYAVTVGGAFFTFTLEPGDLIFINNDIAANSNPNVGNFTVVQSGQSIATAGATDGATTKGVAGFDSGNFGVTSNGFVTLDDVATAGSKGGASKSLSATITAKGLVTSLSEQNIDITASQVSDFCAAVSTCIGANEQYSDTIGDGSATSIAVNHQLGLDVIIQAYEVSTGATVFPEVTRSSTSSGTATFAFTTAPTLNSIKVLITKVS